jgi:tight adherence protein B
VTLGATFLLLLATLAVLVSGLWYAFEGWAQRADVTRRLRQAEGRPAARPRRAVVDARLRRTRAGRALDQRLTVAGIGLPPTEALLAVVAIVVAAYLVAWMMFGPVVAVAAAGGAIVACLRYVDHRRAQRREEFVAQLPELAWTMSNASAAGLVLPRMIELGASELGPPASEVLQRVVEELRVGQSVDRALENLHRRMPSREVGVLVTTLNIQQRTGGDAVAALREMAHTLDARKDLRREVRTTIAGAVTTSWAVGGLAVAALLMLNAMNPGVLGELTRTGLGRITLLLGLGLFALGFVLIRRTTRIET